MRIRRGVAMESRDPDSLPAQVEAQFAELASELSGIGSPRRTPLVSRRSK
jgi:hypothetical protein